MYDLLSDTGSIIFYQLCTAHCCRQFEQFKMGSQWAIGYWQDCITAYIFKTIFLGKILHSFFLFCRKIYSIYIYILIRGVFLIFHPFLSDQWFIYIIWFLHCCQWASVTYFCMYSPRHVTYRQIARV